MDFLHPELEAYVADHTTAEPAMLHALNRETHLKVLQARMLSGHLQGRVLSMISHMLRPRQVLEIGTYTGYSALCLAEGLQAGGHLHTIDINEELEPIVHKYIGLTANVNRITFHIGDALEVLESLNGPFDLVFIDADKTNYLKYYEAVFAKVPVGGYIIADNVLWSGKVINENEVARDPDTAAVVAFNSAVHADLRVENVLMPIRDGLMVIRKIAD